MLVHPQFSPIALQLGPVAIHWYGITYLVAFGLFLWLAGKRAAMSQFASVGWTRKDVEDLLFYGVLGVVIGGRLGYVLFYKPGYYAAHPLEVFAVWKGGMAFHGGLLGVIAAMGLFARLKRRPFLQVMDLIAPCVPTGLASGRIGNFINGELWGREADPSLPWAMVFPRAKRFPTSLPWVREVAEKAGLALDGAMVNLPRHPSQLYEALFEGVVLWLVLWFIVRPRKPFKGFAVGAYLVGYGLVRFVIEYFREPDADLGYIVKLGDPDASIHLFTTPLNFSMGQLLCFMMIVGGLAFIAIVGRRAKRESSLLAAAEAERARLDSAKKKLRKR